MKLHTSFQALTLALVFLLVESAHAEDVVGKVVGVHDGDSITLLTSDKQEVKVRLEGIDAPELKQPFGTASKQALSDLVFGRNVRLRVTGKDRYQRTLGDVFVAQTWINLAMVERGFAWHFAKYSKDERLRSAEIRARAVQAGLWRDAAPIAPWNWRKK